METENKDWKPEVGKTAWLKRYSDKIEQVMITADYTTKLHYKQMIQIGEGEVAEYYSAQDRDYFFESPEAALASIKIYDLEGKEVLITRASVENPEAPIKLSKEREMQLLNLAIAYGDADYQQKDGADRAWHHVATAREKLIAFVENREPELDDEY